MAIAPIKILPQANAMVPLSKVEGESIKGMAPICNSRPSAFTGSECNYNANNVTGPCQDHFTGVSVPCLDALNYQCDTVNAVEKLQGPAKNDECVGPSTECCDLNPNGWCIQTQYYRCENIDQDDDCAIEGWGVVHVRVTRCVHTAVNSPVYQGSRNIAGPCS